MDWYCIQIEQHRLSHAINLTFRNMLIEEYRDHGALDNSRVYRQIHLGNYAYLFSPGAAKALQIFVEFWKGVPVAAPADLSHMDVVI